MRHNTWYSGRILKLYKFICREICSDHDVLFKGKDDLFDSIVIYEIIDSDIRHVLVLKRIHVHVGQK